MSVMVVGIVEDHVISLSVITNINPLHCLQYTTFDFAEKVASNKETEGNTTFRWHTMSQFK